MILRSPINIIPRPQFVTFVFTLALNRLGYRSPATFDKDAREFYDVIYKYLMDTYKG